MFLKLRHFVCLALLSAPLFALLAADLGRDEPGAGPASADAPGNLVDEAATQERIVVLRNGELLRGRVERSGDYFDVAQRDGEIHVRSSDVEAVCKDLDECYQTRRSRIVLGGAADYIALAEWCLRRQLLVQASDALAEAVAADPAHPKLSLLRRRLELAEAEPASETPAGAKADDHVSPEELDRASRALPPRSMEVFTNTVQPLLLNHCAIAGCHGPQSVSAFRLMRLPSNRAANRRSTQRNLLATLAVVDRDRPSASPLLTAPAGPHGTTTSPIFSGRQSHQFQQLVDWVSLVSGQRIEGLPAGAEDIAERAPGRLPAIALQAKPLAASNSEKRGARVAAPSEPFAPAEVDRAAYPSPEGPAPWPASATGGAAAMDVGSATGAGAIKGRGVRASKPPKRGAAPDAFVPADEFDPEIFNRAGGRNP